MSVLFMFSYKRCHFHLLSIANVNARQSDGMPTLLLILILRGSANTDAVSVIGIFIYLFFHYLPVLTVHLKVNSLLFDWEDFLMDSA